MRSRWMMLLLAAVGVAPVAAQRLGTAEVSVFGRATLMDPSVRSDPAAGIGGRVGVFVRPGWLLEVDLSTTSAGGLDYRPLHVRLNTIAAASDRASLIAGVGYVHDSYGGGLQGHDGGVGALVGLRFGLRRTMFWRLDATLDYIPSPANGVGDNWHTGGQVGVGYRFGPS